MLDNLLQEIYTNVRVKLGKDKLMAAVNAAIESIPGVNILLKIIRLLNGNMMKYGTNPDYR